MNKNLMILLVGCLVIGAGIIFTDPDISQSFAVNNRFVPSNPSKKTTFNKNSNEVEIAKIQRVVDGDTVELADGRKVRLLNIDTPETVKKNTPIKCYGKEASNYTKLILTDKTVQLVSDKENTDKYGRELRMIFLEGKDTTKPEDSLNGELIKKGYARAVAYKPNTTFEKPLRDLELIAKEKKLGVWSCPSPFEL